LDKTSVNEGYARFVRIVRFCEMLTRSSWLIRN
jgi:hypothetical protein